ncbi:hypothetical protein [Planococcus sp. CAU13]|uniref:hypothetical protein n=1 Tax=Planococcus sp. CAU13 TaxID=1541197 RepID=UPI00052FF1CE|nr:hypothetical protein [Planococcus sp. CAU13]
MSISIRIYEDGKKITEEIYGGASSSLLFNLLKEKYDNLIVSEAECDDAKELSVKNAHKYICLDNTNVLGFEREANFMTEIVLKYEHTAYTDIKNLITS